jgi:hypothetical protein
MRDRLIVLHPDNEWPIGSVAPEIRVLLVCKERETFDPMRGTGEIDHDCSIGAPANLLK